MTQTTFVNFLRRAVFMVALIYGGVLIYDFIRQDACLDRGATWNSEDSVCECTEVGGIWRDDQTCRQKFNIR